MNHRLIGFIIYLIFGLVWMCYARPSIAQNERQTSTSGKVNLLHVDSMFFDERVSREAQFLIGNVQFEHEGTYMYCDSALYYEKSNSFDAYGNVRMVQGDTLYLYGDELFYDGEERLVRVRYNVVLQHVETTLYTDSLDYDRLYNLGYFFDGGTLVDKENELSSDWGEYSPTTRNAIFYYNVQLLSPGPPQEPRSRVLSDTLYYNTLSARAHLKGPSTITHGENHAYTELAYYYTNDEFAYFLDRSVLTNNGKRMVGDSLVWSAKTKEAEAFGNILYQDTIQKNIFTGNYCYYNDSTSYMQATDSAVIMDYSQRDTLFAHADTFKVYSYNLDTDSIYRTMHAFNHVRLYRSDIQAVCDSLVYVSKDSCLSMYRDPILWQNGQQLVGEEIKAYMNDSTMDSVLVLRQALSVEKLDTLHYNQITGKEMRFYFKNGGIDLTRIIDNVRLNYYPLDEDSLMIGMNFMESTELKIYMKDKKVAKIWAPTANGKLTPIPLIPANELFLENFAWFDYVRPLNRDDIFNWRPKKAEYQLKETSVREAPKQKLSDISKKQK